MTNLHDYALMANKVYDAAPMKGTIQKTKLSGLFAPQDAFRTIKA